MARLRPLGILLALFSAYASGTPLAAQSAANPLLAPKVAPTPAAPGRAPAGSDSEGSRKTRAISPEVAAQLAGFAPKYTPPPPKPAPKPEEEEVTDAREADRPRNNIIRLPKYIVQEAKPPIFTERAINTKKGITDIALRRYISDMDRALNRFTIPLFGMSKEKRAMAMYAEDERLKNMSDMRDVANTAGKSDAAMGEYIKKESQKTFMRTSDFGWNGGGTK